MFSFMCNRTGEIQARLRNDRWKDRVGGNYATGELSIIESHRKGSQDKEAIMMHETNSFWIDMYKSILDPNRWLNTKK